MVQHTVKRGKGIHLYENIERKRLSHYVYDTVLTEV